MFVLLVYLFAMPPTSATIETLEQVGQQLLSTGGLLSKVIASLLVVLVLLLVRRVLNNFVRNRSSTASNIYFWHKVIGYSTTILMVLIIGAIWLYGVGNLALFLGLLVAGLIVALQEPLVNLAGWLFIIARHPITLGDRIEINTVKGDVIDIGPLYFSVVEIGQLVDADQSSGRIIHIPNKMVFSHPVANYTQQFPYIWEEIPVSITFESNWKKAKVILNKIVQELTPSFNEEEERNMRKLATTYFIKLGKLTPIVYTSVEDSGVVLTMRYLVPVRQRRNLDETIWEAVLQAFAKADDIEFAYRTQRVFYNPKEGKAGAGGPKPQDTQT